MDKLQGLRLDLVKIEFGQGVLQRDTGGLVECFLGQVGGIPTSWKIVLLLLKIQVCIDKKGVPIPSLRFLSQAGYE